MKFIVVFNGRLIVNFVVCLFICVLMSACTMPPSPPVHPSSMDCNRQIVTSDMINAEKAAIIADAKSHFGYSIQVSDSEAQRSAQYKADMAYANCIQTTASADMRAADRRIAKDMQQQRENEEVLDMEIQRPIVNTYQPPQFPQMESVPSRPSPSYDSSAADLRDSYYQPPPAPMGMGEGARGYDGRVYIPAGADPNPPSNVLGQ